jgi:hypothetical protein
MWEPCYLRNEQSDAYTRRLRPFMAITSEGPLLTKL